MFSWRLGSDLAGRMDNLCADDGVYSCWADGGRTIASAVSVFVSVTLDTIDMVLVLRLVRWAVNAACWVASPVVRVPGFWTDLYPGLGVRTVDLGSSATGVEWFSNRLVWSIVFRGSVVFKSTERWLRYRKDTRVDKWMASQLYSLTFRN